MRGKRLEFTFLVVFSLLILAIFYGLLSMNGLVLGNDPAVHLEKAQIFLQTGNIPLDNLGWTPPLYQILLVMFISFSGASGVGELILLVKVTAVIINWLLFMSIYLLASKFFNKKIGAVAIILLLLCFPMYELNMWGGYTTLLGLAFMFLLFMYIPLAREDFGHNLVIFLVAFAMVLTHQLAAFLAIIVLTPVILFMFMKSKGTNLKVLIAIILGGGLAFFLYYFRAMIGYMDVIIEHVFFTQKAYAYQIPQTTIASFLVNFGFIFLFSFAGIFISYKMLGHQKRSILYLLLILSFVVPLALTWSYLVGLYLPYHWFIYYLMPPMVVLASVSIVFLVDRLLLFTLKFKKSMKTKWLKVITILVVILVSSMVVSRSEVVYGKIMEASVFYSTMDIKAYEAGAWLRMNYPGEATVVVTEIPGYWFRAFSGKNIIAQTDPVIQRNEIAESVLELSYEIEHPKTIVRAYEAKGDISEEKYVSLDHVWNRVSYSSGSGNFLSFTHLGIDHRYVISELNREIVFEDQSCPKKLTFVYFNDYIVLTQTVLVQNNSYPLNIVWTLLPLKNSIQDVTLYLSTFFDLSFNFQKVHIPGLMEWANPWNISSSTKENDWAVTSFMKNELTDRYIGIFDEDAQVAFAIQFIDLPDWGNIGALTSGQIDALRFHYQFSELNLNQLVSIEYEIITLSRSSFSALRPVGLKNLFDYETTVFEVRSRDYFDYIIENNIKFIVYDKNKLDSKIILCRMIELIYSNDRYLIFKIIN